MFCHLQIVWEALLSLFLGVIGASLSAPELKEITWASEMKRRSVVSVIN